MTKLDEGATCDSCNKIDFCLFNYAIQRKPLTENADKRSKVMVELHTYERILGIFCEPKHYENMPMQHTAIFHGCKNDNFQLIVFYFFHIFAQNIDCGYTLEPPQ